MSCLPALKSGFIASFVCIAPALAELPEAPDLSQCDNCKDFPVEWLEVDKAERLDLDALPAERRLDFLVGEWELLFPYKSPDGEIQYTTDVPVGFEVFQWRDGRQKILEGFQEWPFTSGGKYPFRARSEFRYIEDEQRWQLTWLTNSTAALFTGGLEEDGIFALYEFTPTGDRRSLALRPGMRYVLRNITKDRFIAEEWNRVEGAEEFEVLKWRVLYRRRH